jgi:hypothetical protein
MGTVLDVAGRSKFLSRGVVAIIEKRVKSLQYKCFVHGLVGFGH